MLLQLILPFLLQAAGPPPSTNDATPAPESESASASDQKGSDQIVVKGKKPQKEVLICHRETSVGSMISKRVCRNERQAKEEAKAARDVANQMSTRQAQDLAAATRGQ